MADLHSYQCCRLRKGCKISKTELSKNCNCRKVYPSKAQLRETRKTRTRKPNKHVIKLYINNNAYARLSSIKQRQTKINKDRV